jgi:hypothetical protein
MNGDATGLGFRAALDADMQYALAILGGYAVRVHIVRQAHYAPEAAGETLIDM